MVQFALDYTKKELVTQRTTEKRKTWVLALADETSESSLKSSEAYYGECDGIWWPGNYTQQYAMFLQNAVHPNWDRNIQNTAKYL